MDNLKKSYTKKFENCLNDLFKSVKKDLSSPRVSPSSRRASPRVSPKARKDSPKARKASPRARRASPKARPDYLKEFSKKDIDRALEHLNDELDQKRKKVNKQNINNLLMDLKKKFEFTKYIIAKPPTHDIEDLTNAFIYHYLDNNRTKSSSKEAKSSSKEAKEAKEAKPKPRSRSPTLPSVSPTLSILDYDDDDVKVNLDDLNSDVDSDSD